VGHRGSGCARTSTGDADLWSQVAADGWASESAELANFVRSFGRIITHSAGVHCFLAELEGRPVAAAALSLNGDIALLAGASTIPQARRQGAQQALLDARLRFAAEAGAGLAMMVAAPGSSSQRNAERQGFRIAYTRSKWRLQDR
jgi:GNAT superfamily N-acetyltransferase